MSKKPNLPAPTQELLKVIGTKNQLKKKVLSLTDPQLEKLANTVKEVTEEVMLEREVQAEESKRFQSILENTLTNLSKEHNVPLDEIKNRTSQL
ncbi:hypothetical protein [Vibrio sp. THAF190c]|jgi:hypothetical protein|uniref:hypothetical protein n=1 Tax=Vibrio sp. THAF190c TaxID=2587865 RepID=UPI0012698600|nr:hypothetical protein [Vibrio sp. THAF190c]QFT13428.1 hypothetical protein FIV04_26095 [Vibrio sp. THAF190c]